MRFPRFVLVIAAVLALVVLLLTTGAPRSPDTPPKPEDIAVVKGALAPLRDRADNQPVDLALSPQVIAAGATLASSAVSPVRVSASYRERQATIWMDYPLPLGRWLSGKADLTQGKGVLPQVRMRIGHLPVPAVIATPLSRAALALVRHRYKDLPDPQTITEKLDFQPQALIVRLKLPPGIKLFAELSKLMGNETADNAAVARIYCVLSDQQKQAPSRDFAVHVRRAFSAANGDIVTANRSALAALPLFLGEPRSLRLFGGLTPEMERCGGKGAAPILLGGREDLAHHWAVSAVLATGIGKAPTEAIGGWKELSDSLAGGSGYSFVDLSADRSGFRYGRAAVDPAQATLVRERLGRITGPTLLPPALLGLKESLSAEEFVRTFGNEGSPRYKAVLARIDQALDGVGVPR